MYVGTTNDDADDNGDDDVDRETGLSSYCYLNLNDNKDDDKGVRGW